MNRVTLIGRCGKDPETRQTESFKVANFSLATSKHFKDKDGNKQEKTEWHNIVCFSNLAGIAEKYIHKGDQVMIEGEIQTRSWDDKDGVKRYTTEIIANNIELLGGKSEAKKPEPEIPAKIDKEELQDDTPNDTDGLPF